VLVARNRKDQNARPGLNGASYNGPFFSIAATRTRRATLLRMLCLETISSTPNIIRPIGHFRFTDVEAYVADSWKITRHLSLEFGCAMPGRVLRIRKATTLPASIQLFTIPL